jgi:glycosyltransferase involved in cell wall biosynthesis
MHVVLLSYHFLPRIGGVELAVHSVAQALVAAGVEVTVVVPTAVPGNPPYRVVALPRWRGIPRWVRAWAALARLHWEHPVDVLHAHMLYPAGADACRFGRWAKIPVVVTPQGADVHVYEPLGYGMRCVPGMERRLRSVLRRAAAVTVSSRLMRRELALIDATAAERAIWLPNGTVLERFRGREREVLRHRFGVKPEEVVFITVSRASPIKGLPYLLRAAERLVREGLHGWRLWIAGIGTAELQQSFPELPNVEVLGEFPLESDASGIPVQPPRALVERLCAADVYVTAALSGGFELSCADAFAAGLPIIICRTNGAQDLVEDYQTGCVVPPADVSALAEALRWMMCHPDERLAMRQRALQVAELLDWHVIAQRCVQLYEHLLATWHRNG